MAGAIARAERDLANLRREIGDLEQRLASAREQADKIAVFLEMAQVYGTNGGSATSSTDESASGSASGLAKAAAQEVIAILRERGRPVQTKHLLITLREHGIEISGQNPVSNLSGYLSRSPELTADRATGWSLVEWPKSEDGARTIPVTHSAVRGQKPKGGVAAAAIRETVTILRDRERPIKTRELLGLLASRGIVIGGKQPVINLSSSLCRAPELVSDRGHGWSLREWQPSLLSQAGLDHAAE